MQNLTSRETDHTIALLREQNILLRKLVDAQNASTMGFSDRPPGTPQWVFIGRNGDSCWYLLDKNSQPVPIHHRALTGWLIDLRFEKVTRRNTETHKLNLTVKTNTNTYVLTTGHDTCFAKSLMRSLEILSPSQLVTPVTLTVVPGKDESIVWCRLYAPKYVQAPQWGNDTDFRPIAQAAINNIKTANMTEDVF